MFTNGMFNGHISLIYSVHFTDIVSYSARRQLNKRTNANRCITFFVPTNRDFLQQRNAGSKV